MTSKLTRERIELIANFHRAMTLPPSHAEIEELARMALAALDSEPVAWTWHYREQWHVTNDEERARDLAWDGVKIEPLYRHAQPAPEKCPAEIRDLIASHSDALFNDDDAQEIWNACRAARLKAQPQNAPQNIPEIIPKWIPVSERMPDDAKWCVVNTDYGYYVQCWSKGQGWLGDDISIPNCDVTHWMPIAAAPQEVKGES